MALIPKPIRIWFKYIVEPMELFAYGVVVFLILSGIIFIIKQ